MRSRSPPRAVPAMWSSVTGFVVADVPIISAKRERRRHRTSSMVQRIAVSSGSNAGEHPKTVERLI